MSPIGVSGRISGSLLVLRFKVIFKQIIAQWIFGSHNDYHGLQEAIEPVIFEEAHDVEIDLVALFPEPSALPDKEEGDYDNFHSNFMPQDIPTEVQRYTARYTDIGRVKVFLNRGDGEWVG